jgi:hypothetical protein
MAHLQYTDVQDRHTEFLDLTSLTLDEFQLLVAPFEAAFQAHMAAWRLDGKPRTARQFAVYKNCPLPTPDDRLFFILTYLKTYSLQVVQGRLFGMRQSKANQWIHVLLPALLAALRTLGDAPARSLAALAQRLGVTETDAPSVVSSVEEDKPRHDLRYTSVHFSRPYPVRTNSNSTNCGVEKALCACRRRVCGRYSTNDSWGVSGRSAPCGEAKRVG